MQKPSIQINLMFLTLSLFAAQPLGAETSAQTDGPTSGQRRGDQAYTCNRAADKIDSMINEWRDFVVDYNGQAQNAAVLKMAAEHRAGRLKANFKKHCNAQWSTHHEIFVCFGGSVSALGLAICRHPDFNPNNWQY